ncbi:hypothetical protein ASPBRDRAFT_511124 [Aspergillus brasiliensis CBS 101740]|uniref:Uncharacterized protein n=1 Tax=Aspergillus brasiliensis (strain CBS 101740 / IMI 381727 / IBT 21946) TaxID=767769 RepID=A0A1L9UPG1_ASPBC|nr:hypothetical protein ASPBRDRAFT_511124 [Aspergillus brasiliensis CBS 101740]
MKPLLSRQTLLHTTNSQQHRLRHVELLRIVVSLLFMSNIYPLYKLNVYYNITKISFFTTTTTTPPSVHQHPPIRANITPIKAKSNTYTATTTNQPYHQFPALKY